MTRTIGRYEVRGVAGRGAMGVVYDAWDPTDQMRVAVKTLSLATADADALGEQLTRFKREAHIATNLVHPNIVRVFDSGSTEEDAFLVMEFIEGQSLREALDSGRRFTLAETLDIMRSVLSALGYSHSRGVIHRDIKPANLMLTNEGVVKVADFGVARIEGSSVTQTGVMVGTPAYMSPEQFLGEPVDARSDVYSCGALLYQLLTGEKPFDGGMASIIYKALHTTLPKPSGLSIQAPPVLDNVVARAMARNPNDRYPDAASFSGAIERARADPTRVMARPPPVMPRQVPPHEHPAAVSVVPPAAARPDLRRSPAMAQTVTSYEVDDYDRTRGSTVGNLLRVLMFFAVIGVGVIVLYDLYSNQPIGTGPGLSSAPVPEPYAPYRSSRPGR